jgi:hypothetical protein
MSATTTRPLHATPVTKDWNVTPVKEWQRILKSQPILKSQSILKSLLYTDFSQYTRALTFENLCLEPGAAYGLALALPHDRNSAKILKNYPLYCLCMARALGR